MRFWIFVSLVVATTAVAQNGTPTSTTPPPTPTAICPLGDGHPLLCRGGSEQGKLCAQDADCAGDGICTRHGHPLECLEQCLGAGLPGGPSCLHERHLPGRHLGGLPGDDAGDNVVGYCSTEGNRNFGGHPTDARSAWFLAYNDAAKPVELWVGQAEYSAAKVWTGADITTTDSPAAHVLGQTNFYQSDWYQITGDGTINGNSVPYGLDQNTGVFVAAGPAGEVWVADTVWARKYNAPHTIDGALPDLVLCRDRDTSHMTCSPHGIAVAKDGMVAMADPGASRVIIWNRPPTTDGQPPDVALGQPDLKTGECNSGSAGVSSQSLCLPESVAFMADGKLVVSDTGNHRVLIYSPPFTHHKAASAVLCQPNFVTRNPGTAANKCNGPEQVTSFGTAVMLADRHNNRVLYWADAIHNPTPQFVIGQALFTTASPGLSATEMEAPAGVAIGGGSFFVAGQHRVTRFAYPPRQNQPAALSVLGQPALGVGFHRKATRLSGFFTNAAEAFDGHGGVYVTDPLAHRILYWAKKADSHRGLPASLILGQAGGPNDQFGNRGGPPGADTLNAPTDIAVDAANNLYVSDSGNNRVLEFDDPTMHDGVADRVFGQAGSFTTDNANRGGISAGSLYMPQGIHVDAQGQLWVTDFWNHRLLRFSTPLTSQVADLVLGQSDFTANDRAGCTSPTASSLCSPVDVLHDVAHNRLWAIDCGPGACRTFFYSGPTYTNGMAASIALDNASFAAFSTGNHSLAVHPVSGNLYTLVAPGAARYTAPFTAGQQPSQCFGMNDCSNRGGGTGYVTCAWATVAGQLAFDSHDNELWVPGAGEGAGGIVTLLDPEAGAAAATMTPTVQPTPSPTSPPPASLPRPTNVGNVVLPLLGVAAAIAVGIYLARTMRGDG